MLFIPTLSQRFKRLPQSPFHLFNQKGQSIVIMAFAFIGLIAMLGLALDLGLVYIERTQIKRAVDAATLAAVVELPNEENAYLRAIAYLDENGYPTSQKVSDAELKTVNLERGEFHGEWNYTIRPRG